MAGNLELAPDRPGARNAENTAVRSKVRNGAIQGDAGLNRQMLTGSDNENSVSTSSVLLGVDDRDHSLKFLRTAAQHFEPKEPNIEASPNIIRTLIADTCEVGYLRCPRANPTA